MNLHARRNQVCFSRETQGSSLVILSIAISALNWLPSIVTDIKVKPFCMLYFILFNIIVSVSLFFGVSKPFESQAPPYESDGSYGSPSLEISLHAMFIEYFIC